MLRLKLVFALLVVSAVKWRPRNPARVLYPMFIGLDIGHLPALFRRVLFANGGAGAAVHEPPAVGPGSVCRYGLPAETVKLASRSYATLLTVMLAQGHNHSG